MCRLTGSWYFYKFRANFLLFGLCAALGLISSWPCWGCSGSLYYSWIVAVAPCGTLISSPCPPVLGGRVGVSEAMFGGALCV